MNALGRHLITEFYGCEPARLDEVGQVEQAMIRAAEAAQATVVNVSFHHFAPYGVSGVVMIQESHLTIHTWPEYGFASVDLFTCGDTTDPWAAFAHLKTALAAEHASTIEMARGALPLLAEHPFQPRKMERNQIAAGRQSWFTERDKDLALSCRYESLLHRRESAHQLLELYQTSAFGKMLTINGQIALTEQDEAAYHEMAVHVPLERHPCPERILIVGGGDGGMAKECLRHRKVTQILVIERDPEVVSLAKTYFPNMASALDDPRVRVEIAEAGSFLRQYEGSPFDVILLDGLKTSGSLLDFHKAAVAHLAANGLYLTSIGSPSVDKNAFNTQQISLRSIFSEHIQLFHSFIPSYPTGLWFFALACRCYLPDFRPAPNPELADCHYYNYQIHQAAFALPNFMKK